MDTQTYLIEQARLQHAKTTDNRNSHYRSQLYTSKAGLNPLITASHPIFSILERIKLCKNVLDIKLIQNNLLHELKAFEGHADMANYSRETILITRYILGAMVDETITKKLQEKHDYFTDFESFVPVDPNNIGADQRFFQILSKLIKHPDQYLDLLELIYLCLSCGFEGKYRFQPNGKTQLDDLIDQLYMTISPLRERQAATFYKKNAFRLHIPQKSSSMTYKLFIGSCILSILCIYAGTSYYLDKRADNLLTQHFSAAPNWLDYGEHWL